MPDTVLILAGGNEPSPPVRRALPPAAMCLAADSGIDHARALGLVPDVIVGDFDSVSDEGLAWAETAGARVVRHPPSKAETDLEIALAEAVATDPDRVVVVGIGGGRVDHLLANFMVLASSRFAGTRVDAMVDTALVSVVHSRRALRGAPDELLSLLPIGGPAEGVTTSGLGYSLDGETLHATATRGVSNYFVGTEAEVSLAEGTLLAVQPHRLGQGGTDEPSGAP